MTRPDLPPCSVVACKRAAGVIMNGALLCDDHALEELKKLRQLRKGNRSENSP